MDYALPIHPTSWNQIPGFLKNPGILAATGLGLGRDYLAAELTVGEDYPQNHQQPAHQQRGRGDYVEHHRRQQNRKHSHQS